MKTIKKNIIAKILAEFGFWMGVIIGIYYIIFSGVDGQKKFDWSDTINTIMVLAPLWIPLMGYIIGRAVDGFIQDTLGDESYGKIIEVIVLVISIGAGLLLAVMGYMGYDGSILIKIVLVVIFFMMGAFFTFLHYEKSIYDE